MLGRLSARAAHTLQLRLSALYGQSAGARIWDSGREMAALLQQQGESLRGKRVLELGAGTGIGGLSAAACGADVLLSDQAHMLPLLNENIIANGLQVQAAGRAPCSLQPAACSVPPAPCSVPPLPPCRGASLQPVPSTM